RAQSERMRSNLTSLSVVRCPLLLVCGPLSAVEFVRCPWSVLRGPWFVVCCQVRSHRPGSGQGSDHHAERDGYKDGYHVKCTSSYFSGRNAGDVARRLNVVALRLNRSLHGAWRD